MHTQSALCKLYIFPNNLRFLKRKLVNFNFIWKSEFSGWGESIFSIPPNHECRITKNEKLDLGILWHLEQLLGLGWSFQHTPNHECCTQKWNVGFRHFVTFGTIFRVRVGHFSIPPTTNIAPKNKKLDLGILWHLEQLLGLGWIISAYPQPRTLHPKMKSWI